MANGDGVRLGAAAQGGRVGLGHLKSLEPGLCKRKYSCKRKCCSRDGGGGGGGGGGADSWNLEEIGLWVRSAEGNGGGGGGEDNGHCVDDEGGAVGAACPGEGGTAGTAPEHRRSGWCAMPEGAAWHTQSRGRRRWRSGARMEGEHTAGLHAMAVVAAATSYKRARWGWLRPMRMWSALQGRWVVTLRRTLSGRSLSIAADAAVFAPRHTRVSAARRRLCLPAAIAVPLSPTRCSHPAGSPPLDASAAAP
uniref:Uncharacterized protein n=1 Tax=Oryza sativa subsp. japonica TaxID=39947 RepID=Q8S748_ORYSJ|nr:Hypothetical protein [Oryza sativa Japonica Group]